MANLLCSPFYHPKERIRRAFAISGSDSDHQVEIAVVRAVRQVLAVESGYADPTSLLEQVGWLAAS